MKFLRQSAVHFIVLLVFLSVCTQETEGVRQVLRGRRTMTRSYYRGLPIPAWAIIAIVSVVYLIIGAILYLVLRKVVVQQPLENVNSYTPAMQEDISMPIVSPVSSP